MGVWFVGRRMCEDDGFIEPKVNTYGQKWDVYGRFRRLIPGF